MIAEGIYKDLSSEAYHGDKNSISRSVIMDFKRSPRYYAAKHLTPNKPKEQKDSWTFGTAFHMYCLEPQLFWKYYAIKFESTTLKELIELYGKEKGRILFEEQKMSVHQLEKGNKTIISQKDYENLGGMLNSITFNLKAMELLRDCVIESSYFWKDKESGLMLKSRPDILHPKIYVDLKTIGDASARNYQHEMVKFGYHIQAAMVEDGVKALTGESLLASINICVEKTYPYGVGIYIIDESAIEAGRSEYKEILLNLKSCIMKNEFKDYEVQTITLPRWY